MIFVKNEEEEAPFVHVERLFQIRCPMRWTRQWDAQEDLRSTIAANGTARWRRSRRTSVILITTQTEIPLTYIHAAVPSVTWTTHLAWIYAVIATCWQSAPIFIASHRNGSPGARETPKSAFLNAFLTWEQSCKVSCYHVHARWLISRWSWRNPRVWFFAWLVWASEATKSHLILKQGQS